MPTIKLGGLVLVILRLTTGAAAGVIGAATAQPAGVPVAVHSDASAGTPPVGLTVALFEPTTATAAACGVTLMVKPTVAPPAIPAAVVMVQARSRPAACVPDTTQLAAVAPAPGAALLNAKLGGSLSLIATVVPEVAAPAALLTVSM